MSPYDIHYKQLQINHYVIPGLNTKTGAMQTFIQLMSWVDDFLISLLLKVYPD